MSAQLLARGGAPVVLRGVRGRVPLRFLCTAATVFTLAACHQGDAIVIERPTPEPPPPAHGTASASKPNDAGDARDDPAVPAPKSLENLGPFYEAHVRDGKLEVIVPASSLEEWDEWSNSGRDRLPATDPAIPLDVRALGRIFVVSTSGVKTLNRFESVDFDIGGWVVEYPASDVVDPVFGVTTRPVQGTRIRAPRPMADIGKAHPRARLLAEHERQTNSGDGPVELQDFAFQELAGRFGAADRVVAIRAFSRQDDWDVPFNGHGIIATLDADGNVVHEVDSGGDCFLDGVFDLDGDGIDEILFTEQGYEFMAQWVVKLSPAIERVQLLEYAH